MAGRVIPAGKGGLEAAPGHAAKSQGSAAAERSAGTLPVTWEITPADRSGEVQLSLRHRTRNSDSHNSRNYPVSELQGLVPGSDGPVRFRMAREAGTLDCQGEMRAGRGSGRC